MRFCLEVWGTDYEKIKDICILAEKLGYYGFYHGAMERKPNLYKTKLKRIQINTGTDSINW